MPQLQSSTEKKQTPQGVAAPTNYQRHVLRYIDHNAKNEKRKSLFLHYKKKNGRTVKRKVDPLSLKDGRILAYDHKRKALRSFYLDKVKHMEKSAFWAGFEKQAAESALSMVSHLPKAGYRAVHDKLFGRKKKESEKQANAAAELAGLGMLAVPSVQHLRGKPMKEDTMHKIELAGLGTLAAPYVWGAGKKLLSRGKA